MPPSATTHALSDSIKRTSRRSSAPIARRSENSRRRDSVRASSRLATLAHAITSTNATAPNSSEIAGLICPNTSLESGDTSTPRFSLVSGYACASCCATLVTSACACSIETPGASLASAGKPRLPRAARPCGGADAIIDTHTSLASDRPLNVAGAMPTIVNTWLPSRIDLADRVGRAAVGAIPQLFADHRDERRVWRHHPPTSSARPSTGSTPSAEKYSPATISPSMRSGAPLPYMMKPLSLQAENEIERLALRLPIQIVGNRRAAALDDLSFDVAPQLDEAIRFRIRQRT